MNYEAIFERNSGFFIVVSFSADKDRDALLAGQSPEMCKKAQELAKIREDIYYGSLRSILRIEEGKPVLIYPGIYYIDGLTHKMTNFWGDMSRY